MLISLTIPVNATTAKQEKFSQITITDALEILKSLADMKSIYDKSQVKPTIGDALEVLKYLAGIAPRPVLHVKGEIDFKVVSYARIYLKDHEKQANKIHTAYSLDELNSIYDINETAGYYSVSQERVKTNINETLFKNKALVVVYFHQGSSSLRTVIDSLIAKNNTLTVNALATSSSLARNMDVAIFRIVLAVDLDNLKGINKINLSRKEKTEMFYIGECEELCCVDLPQPQFHHRRYDYEKHYKWFNDWLKSKK